MTNLEAEPTISTLHTVPLKTILKPGDVGRHEVKGLRGYRVFRFANREQFVFSALSAFVLSVIGGLHVTLCERGYDGSGLASVES
jgi:hypothetical protein